MRRILLPAVCLWFSAIGMAAADPATDASIRELLQVTQSEKLMDGMYEQVDVMMRASLEQAVAGQTMTPELRKIVDDAGAQVLEIYKREMSWSVLEPTLFEIYRTNFTEAEVRGMLDFYATDAGRALISRMPAVMQSSMRMMQERMTAIVPELKRIQMQTQEKVKALCQDASAPDCGSRP